MRLGTIVAALGALSVLTILYRIVHHPIAPSGQGAGHLHITYRRGIEIGIWIALLAALLITYGGYLAMRDEGAVDIQPQRAGEASAQEHAEAARRPTGRSRARSAAWSSRAARHRPSSGRRPRTPDTRRTRARPRADAP